MPALPRRSLEAFLDSISAEQKWGQCLPPGPGEGHRQASPVLAPSLLQGSGAGLRNTALSLWWLCQVRKRAPSA